MFINSKKYVVFLALSTHICFEIVRMVLWFISLLFRRCEIHTWFSKQTNQSEEHSTPSAFSRKRLGLNNAHWAHKLHTLEMQKSLRCTLRASLSQVKVALATSKNHLSFFFRCTWCGGDVDCSSKVCRARIIRHVSLSSATTTTMTRASRFLILLAAAHRR